MAKITSLTPEQTARLAEFAQKWRKIGLDTRPADRALAEEGVRQAYTTAGLPEPKQIVWCSSPMVALLTIAVLKSLGATVRDTVGDTVRDTVWATVGATVWATVGATVGDTVGATVRATVGDTVRDTVRDTVGATVWATVWDTVGATVRDTVRATVGATVGATVRDTVWDTVRATVGDTVWATVGDTVRATVGDTVRATVGATVGATVRDTVRDTVRATVGDTVRDTVRATWNDLNAWGQHDAPWLSFYDYMRECLGLTTETEKLNGLWKIAKSANWWWAYRDIVFICERHKVVALDEQACLHREDGPAVEYRDGWGVYAWHGVRVPWQVIEEPGSITVKQIDDEGNAEVRRVMLERYGWDRYLLSSSARKIHEDGFGILYRKDINGDEPLVMVEVENATPEPDGSFKNYLIRIDPRAYGGEAGRVAHAAVASTWRNEDNSLLFKSYADYRPRFES